MRIQSPTTTFATVFRFVILLKLLICNNHKRLRILDESLTRSSEFKKSIILNVFLEIATKQGLTNNWIPQFVIHIFTCSKFFQIIVLVRYDVIRTSTLHKVDNILLTEILLDRSYGLKYNQESILRLDLRCRMQTVVTVMAIFLRIFLTEIMEKHLATANRRLCISSSFLQQLPAYILLCHRLVFHKLLQFPQVFSGIKGNTYTFTTISAGTTSFLIISFQTLWNIVMDYKTDIWFVNTHTKGYGGHDYIDFLHQEIILSLRTSSRI